MFSLLSDVSHRPGPLQSISQNKTVSDTRLRHVLQGPSNVLEEHLKIRYNKNTRAAKILPIT